MAKPKPKRKPAKHSSKTLYSVPALEKGFDIVELLVATPDGLTSTEIAQRLGRSLSEIFRSVVVMERRGWLQKSAETDRYSVSYNVLERAFRGSPAQSLGMLAAPVMFRLALATEQSCHMAVISGTNIFLMLQQAFLGHSGFFVRLGDQCDIVRSCSSHVLLAFSDEATRERLLAVAGKTPAAELKQLRQRLKLVAARGYESKPSARHVGIHDVSYPIFGFDGGILAALTIPFLKVIDGTQKVDLEQAEKLLAAAALEISRDLGFAPHR
jgi:DNA-binding IclR family transcriptional regulator